MRTKVVMATHHGRDTAARLLGSDHLERLRIIPRHCSAAACFRVEDDVTRNYHALLCRGRGRKLGTQPRELLCAEATVVGHEAAIVPIHLAEPLATRAAEVDARILATNELCRFLTAGIVLRETDQSSLVRVEDTIAIPLRVRRMYSMSPCRSHEAFANV